MKPSHSIKPNHKAKSLAGVEAQPMSPNDRSQTAIRSGSQSAATSRKATASAAAGSGNTGPAALNPFSVISDQASDQAVQIPARRSFRDFLENDARVPTGKGIYGHYTFAGREALMEVVATIDSILGSETGKFLPDARCAVAGGAQFGKTILELNFIAYVTAQLFRNCGLYLPDDDLVEGIVDSKFRPDVVDQIDWFAEMVQVGKALNKSGKAVNRKGAFLVTDGTRKSVGMIRGLGKVPTTFSMDAAAMDEVDDIKPKMAKFVKGRLTASDLRFILEIGTQRVHGRGMNARWKQGSQGVIELRCESCGRVHQPEEDFPGIIRCAISGTPRRTDPALTYSADFRRAGRDEVVAVHDPTHTYYRACVDCGTPLDATKPTWKHRQPEQIRLRNWSFRISQLAIDAIDLSQIVAGWAAAVVDPEQMIVFRCDVLALPQSTAQALTPETLDRARKVETYDLRMATKPGAFAVAGLDMGDRCWFLSREVESAAVKRLLWVEQIPSANVVARAASLFDLLKLSALFIDQRPLVNESRTLALILNGLNELTKWPAVPEDKDAWMSLPGGLTWDARNQKWIGLKCAVVRFDKKKIGAGIRQGFDVFEDGGQTKFVPLIDCNRFETIDRVVREFLTPKENVVEVVGGAVRQNPAMRLPRIVPGSPKVLEILDAHLITGSEREKEDDGTVGDYVDQAENHFLLANGYSGLAELIAARSKPVPFAHSSTPREATRPTRTRGFV
jgi:hypothetical protein